MTFLKTGILTRVLVHPRCKTVINLLEHCYCEVVRPCMYSREQGRVPYLGGGKEQE